MLKGREAKTAKTMTPAVRCAIYTRKSTEDGLEQEFNSLDAQRLAGENFVRSQIHEGWELLDNRYDDGGFTGGNMERPALQRLMAEIEQGKVDCVVVYKVDRLSRSLLDFARMMEVFENHRISFVSVTQQLNTASSMGRLMLNVLLSFAQFERDIISERTRDKIAAARRQGKWIGGTPLLGYDVSPGTSKLIIHDAEAARVREIFSMYLECQSLLATVKVLNERGWNNKHWVTKKGTSRGGKPFTKTSLHKLLTNVTYLGKVRYKEETHEGEHEAIVDVKTWKEVQVLLQRNGRSGGTVARNRFGALLKGLLRCGDCGCAMTPTHTTKSGTKRYRYYVCTNAQKRGWQSCASPSIPAGEIERFVIDHLKGIVQQPELIEEVRHQMVGQTRERIRALEAEHRILSKDVSRWTREVNEMVSGPNASSAVAMSTPQLADLQDRIRVAEQRESKLQVELAELYASAQDETEFADYLPDFAVIWDSLTIAERVRVVELLVEDVEYQGRAGKVAVTFRADGLSTLATELNQKEGER